MPAQPKGESGQVSQVQSSQSVAAPESGRIPEPVAEANGRSAVVDEKQLGEMVDDLNGFAQSVQRQLHFSVDQDNGKVIVKVVDAETKDVIREIPSEEIRNMQKQLGEVSEKLFHKGEGTSLLFKGQA